MRQDRWRKWSNFRGSARQFKQHQLSNHLFSHFHCYFLEYVRKHAACFKYLFWEMLCSKRRDVLLNCRH